MSRMPRTTTAVAPQAVMMGVKAMISPTVSPINASTARNAATAPKAMVFFSLSATKTARVFW